MKKIIGWLIGFIKEDFQPISYAWFAIFMALTFYYNYTLNFEDDVLDTYQGTIKGVLFFFLFYAFAWFSISIPKIALTNKELLNRKAFWIKASLALLILACTAGIALNWRNYFPNLDFFEYYTMRKVLNYGKNTFLVLLGSFILMVLFKDKDTRFYGFTAKNFSLKPYLILLGLMLPLLIWASFQESFLEQYPNYRPWKYTNNGQLQAMGSIAYLLAYALDFIEVEFIFRGVLVIGMAKVIGKEAVLPMAATYAFLHFGKPMPEAMGSIFGGYILGVISLRGKSILGGIIVHVGIAFLMELMATLQHLF